MIRPKHLLILSLLGIAGCSWLDEKANPSLQGERKDVLQKADETSNTTTEKPQLDLPQNITAWPQQNATAAQTGVHANITPKFEALWSENIGSGFSGRMRMTARPVGADGKIYAMDSDGYVTALDAATGKSIWHVRTRKWFEKALAGGMAVVGNTLYLTNGYPEILALNVQNGALLWKTDLDAPARAAPVAADGKVYVVTRGDQSFALDAASGKVLWQHHGLQELAGVIAGGAPAVNSDMVVVPYASGEVTALAPGNGSVLWMDNLATGRADNNLATLHDLRAPPMIINDAVIAANFSANIAAIERRLGDRVWTENFGVLQPMTVSGDTVFAITINGQLIAVSRKDGTKFWSKSLLPPPPKTGEEPSSDDVKASYWYGPLLLNGQLLVISSGGTTQLRDALTGDVVKEVKDLPEPAENPITMNGVLYWLTTDGDVVAFR